MLQHRPTHATAGPGDVPGDRDGRHPVDAPGLEHVEERVGHPVAVLDGTDAGAERRRDAVRSDSVGRGAPADAVRLVHDRPRLVVGEVHPAVQHAVGGEVIAAVRVVLDPVGPVGRLLAHGETRAVHAVHRLDAVRHLDLPVAAHDRVHPRRRHGARGDEEARPRDLAAVDGALDVHVGVHRPFGLEIAQRGEAVLQGEARVARRENRAVGDRLVQELRVVRLGGGIALQQEVRVRVDEARQHRHLREIDDLRVLRLRLHLGQRTDGADAVTVDEDADVGLYLVGAAVDEATGLDQGRLRPRGGRRLSREGRSGEDGGGESGDECGAAHDTTPPGGPANLPFTARLSSHRLVGRQLWPGGQPCPFASCANAGRRTS